MVVFVVFSCGLTENRTQNCALFIPLDAFVDLPGIEPGPLQCECSVVPFNHRPISNGTCAPVYHLPISPSFDSIPNTRYWIQNTKYCILTSSFYNLFFRLGPWYTGNTLLWHRRVGGSIPLGSTRGWLRPACNAFGKTDGGQSSNLFRSTMLIAIYA